MGSKVEDTDSVARLIEQLAGDDAARREKSRQALVQLGGADVTRALVASLLDPHPHVRWEAAKALQSIADSVAAPALMHALDDEDEDVRWVAAEALIALEKAGLVTVLSGLISRAGSVAFCTSAHHVLHEMKKFAAVVAPVIRALEQSEPAVAAPPAAYKVLVALNGEPAAD
ncbi:MAG: HEAT repeat domain-containing protein [Planctomycetaceae bacterium]